MRKADGANSGDEGDVGIGSRGGRASNNPRTAGKIVAADKKTGTSLLGWPQLFKKKNNFLVLEIGSKLMPSS